MTQHEVQHAWRLQNTFAGLMNYPMTKTIHAEKRCAEMWNLHMDALTFLTDHGLKANTHICVKIAHFPTQCIIRTWKDLGLCPCASQALMMHLVGKCVVFAQAWVLAMIPVKSKLGTVRHILHVHRCDFLPSFHRYHIIIHPPQKNIYIFVKLLSGRHNSEFCH